MPKIMNEELYALEGKYLTFNLKEEIYGINVRWIMQIIAIPDIIQIPKTPDFVRGVINLRGKIVPVMDLRARFSLPENQYNDRTSIIVIEMLKGTEEFNIGLIVDKVLEVIDIDKSEIEDSPSFGVDFDSQFIDAMAKMKGRVITLLAINRILSSGEMKQINQKGE